MSSNKITSHGSLQKEIPTKGDYKYAWKFIAANNTLYEVK